MHLVHAQIIQAPGDAANIKQRIHAADFVELNVFRRAVMHLGLDLRDAPKNAERGFLNTFAQLTGFNQFTDFGHRAPVSVRMLVNVSRRTVVLRLRRPVRMLM